MSRESRKKADRKSGRVAGSKPKPKPAPRQESPAGREVPDPVDVVDGIPDRSSNPSAWKYALIAAVFLAWVAFLIYCQLAGNP